ncbi:MAG: hypothetical protein J6S21_07825, partial [Victivallales bacterium]|nr:hypothetical protein [Victivallales bacterium]
MLFNILDFGAIGDGCTLNTRAFEQVCRAAAEAKDGAAVIVVPPGTYISGSIDLPSNTTLRLELGAVLKSSANPDDLKENTEIFPHRSLAPGMSYDWLPRYFIGAFHQHDVIIEGDGTIDGNGEAFWEDRCHDGEPWIPDNPNYPVCYRV